MTEYVTQVSGDEFYGRAEACFAQGKLINS